MPIRPLLVSYGGGHAQIILRLYNAFHGKGHLPHVLALTTAYHTLKSEGINPLSITDLLQHEDLIYLDVVQKYIQDSSHPLVPFDHTLAYHAIGFRDLIEDYNYDQALSLFQAHGRKCFMPINTMRRFLRLLNPDIVITTTSPRFELAALRAAKREGIPNLAVGDLYLEKEREWILSGDYADHLAVLNSDVSFRLSSDGFSAEKIFVTGNPAFDPIVEYRDNHQLREDLRISLGLNTFTVLFPLAGGPVAMNGQSFISKDDAISKIQTYLCSHPDYTFILRPHPNSSLLTLIITCDSVRTLNTNLSPLDSILISDLIMVEASTMGLEAALMKKPVICIGFTDYVHYPKYGLASSALNLDDALTRLAAGSYNTPNNYLLPPVSNASSNILSLVQKILS